MNNLKKLKIEAKVEISYFSFKIDGDVVVVMAEANKSIQNYIDRAYAMGLGDKANINK